VFRNDFVDNKPLYKGERLALKIHPITNGREKTYYHLTHEGVEEDNRVPNMERMERIGFPKPIIENSENSNVLVWRNKRGTNERILILYEDENYLVVLEDRKNYLLFWTAYYIRYNNKIRRLKKEYEAYKNAETA
jgi:hypothetical protein